MSVRGGGECHVIRFVVCEDHSGPIGGAGVERARADRGGLRRQDSTGMTGGGSAGGGCSCAGLARTGQDLVMCCTWM